MREKTGIGIIDGDGDGVYRQLAIVAKGVDDIDKRQDMIIAPDQDVDLAGKERGVDLGRWMVGFVKSMIDENHGPALFDIVRIGDVFFGKGARSMGGDDHADDDRRDDAHSRTYAAHPSVFSAYASRRRAYVPAARASYARACAYVPAFIHSRAHVDGGAYCPPGKASRGGIGMNLVHRRILA